MKPHLACAIALVCTQHFMTLPGLSQVPSSRPTANAARSLELQTWANKSAAPTGFRLPGEFESPSSLLLGTSFLTSNAPDVFSNLIRATCESTQVVALVNDFADLTAAQNALISGGLPPNCIRFLPIPHNTMWVRDYAPLVLVGRDRQVILIDAAYEQTDRPADDRVPQVLAEQLNLPLLATALKIDGGNLLSNGEGILVATTSLIQCNIELGWNKREIYEQLLALFAAKQIIFVEPLVGEPTTHVDMFAAFVSPDTIVVGAYGDEDKENAAILDRSAMLLTNVETDNGPLRVVRVPMPRHDDGIWRTHTNVAFASRVLLVPIYPSQDDRHSEQVLLTYRTLLPTRRIIGIDAEKISESGGSLHCITMNLGPLDSFPVLPIPVGEQSEVTSGLLLRSR